ncbi:MAG: hypothetical protein GVY36_03855 [Verrucomicrobia bacterium]|nr:hypothetical protein [Verrucomicrobiota bacterium]
MKSTDVARKTRDRETPVSPPSAPDKLEACHYARDRETPVSPPSAPDKLEACHYARDRETPVSPPPRPTSWKLVATLPTSMPRPA